MPTPSKPVFPNRAEYGVMTAADMSSPPLTWEVVRSWLQASKYYWVVTSRADGRPHARAVWGLWLEPRFHFATSPETVMARNIAATGYAIVHPESALNVVILEGAVQRTEGLALTEASDAYEAKYETKMDPSDPGMPFYSLTARTTIAWQAQDPRGSAVRWTFEL
jgi:Pyridoxamine 5'-phosphate oxidase